MASHPDRLCMQCSARSPNPSYENALKCTGIACRPDPTVTTRATGCGNEEAQALLANPSGELACMPMHTHMRMLVMGLLHTVRVTCMACMAAIHADLVPGLSCSCKPNLGAASQPAQDIVHEQV